MNHTNRKLLRIDSSILGGDSVSRRLADRIVERFAADHPGLEVVRRDLAAEPIDHLGAADLGQRHLALDELLAADVIVIGAPMYNFTIPTQLKAWLDRLAVAGTTFKYTAEGPVGLVRGKRVIVASTRGGVYGPGSPDFVEPYLRAFFAFLGLTDLEVVRAEGLAMGPEPRERALDAADLQVAALDTRRPVALAA